MIKVPRIIPLIELREYSLKCDKAIEFMNYTSAASNLRKSLLPLRLFTLPETGTTLNTAYHFYYYKCGLAERFQTRKYALQDKNWTDYISQSRPNVLSQKSTLYSEAKIQTKGDFMIQGLAEETIKSSLNETPLYEFRRYHLQQGDATISEFLYLYESNLPTSQSKLHPSSSLRSLLVSELGPTNEILEIWRHGEGHDALIQTHDTTLDLIDLTSHLSYGCEISLQNPVEFSNWR